jgi:hypothetical protein
MKIFTTLLGLVSLVSLVACSSITTSEKTISETSAFAKTIGQANRSKRYFIMYSGVDTYRVTSAQVEKTKQQFTVHLAKVDSLHAAILKNVSPTSGRLIQMHMRDSTSYTLDEPHTIPINRVARIDLVH